MDGRSPAARTWSRAGLVLLLVLGLDQMTKKLVKDGVARGSEDSVLPGISLVHTKNRGVAFGALEDQTAIVVVVIAIALAALVVYVARHVQRPGIWLPAGLLVGGALGNVFDRARDGEVTDFVKLPAWPAFNVADVAITVGVLTLLYVMDRSDDAEPATDPSPRVGVPGAADSRS